MIDSTNPRSMADNIRHLAGASGSQASDISSLQTTVGIQGNSIEALQTFDDAETDTGMKWINGNTIYRKVFTLDAMPNNTTEQISHGISDLDEVVNLYGVMQTASGQAGEPIPYGNGILLRYNWTVIVVQTSGDLSGNKGIIVMEYTKSAPAALNSPAPDDTRSIESEEIPEDEYIEPEVREEDPIEEPVQEVKKTTRKKSTN